MPDDPSETFRALSGFHIDDPPPDFVSSPRSGNPEVKRQIQKSDTAIPIMVRHIREKLLRCTHEELAHALKTNFYGVIDMENGEIKRRRLEHGFIHRYTKLLQYLQGIVDSPAPDTDTASVQSAMKSLAIALIRSERHHQDHTHWTKVLTVEELLKIYSRTTVNKILAGRRSAGNRTKRIPTPPLPEPNMSEEALPELPSDEYIARLLYDYAHSGEVRTTHSWNNGRNFTLYRDRLTDTLRTVLHARMRRMLRDELRNCSIDEINMDDIIKRAYKELVMPGTSCPPKRYGRTGSANPSSGIKTDYDPRDQW